MPLSLSLVALRLALAFTVAVPAEELPKNVLLADLGLHVIGVGYQRSVTPSFALQLDLESYAPWTQNLNLFGLSGEAFKADTSGYAVRGRLFWYPSAEAPTGLWLSPFVQGGPVTATREGVAVKGTAFAAGGGVGYAWLFKNTVHLAIGGGLQLHTAHLAGGDGIPSFARLYPHLDANLGWAF